MRLFDLNSGPVVVFTWRDARRSVDGRSVGRLVDRDGLSVDRDGRSGGEYERSRGRFTSDDQMANNLN